MTKETNSNLTLNRIKKEAQAEINKEFTAKYVSKYKNKLRDLQSAKLIVSNIEREIADLEMQMENELE